MTAGFSRAASASRAARFVDDGRLPAPPWLADACDARHGGFVRGAALATVADLAAESVAVDALGAGGDDAAVRRFLKRQYGGALGAGDM